MFQDGRPPDNSFRLSDHLYYRCKKEDVIGDRLHPDRIRYENPSVNWSKYSKPWDVIFDNPKFGIARWIVRDLPKDIPQMSKETLPNNMPEPHSFHPSHVPEPLNYSHSEIWTYREGQRIPKLSSSITKKVFRQIMSDKSLVIEDPEI